MFHATIEIYDEDAQEKDEGQSFMTKRRRKYKNQEQIESGLEVAFETGNSHNMCNEKRRRGREGREPTRTNELEKSRDYIRKRGGERRD